MAVLGGFCNFFGPIIGALVFNLLQDQLQSLTQYWRFVLGAILAALVVAWPGGIAALGEDLARRLSRKAAAPLRLCSKPGTFPNPTELFARLRASALRWRHGNG